LPEKTVERTNYQNESMKIVERSFTPADQVSFAALSGDFNPMHLDEVAARRTLFGAPVVHGVHLLFWALESWLSNRNYAPASLRRLTATFTRGALVGETVHTSVVSDGDEFALRVDRGQSRLASIWGKLGAPLAYLETLPPMEAPKECRVMEYAAVSQAAGSLPLSYCGAEANRLFPQLSAALPPFQLAALLATTRLVGMECPGLHSLYSAMALSFAQEATGPPRMNFRVVRADGGGGLRLAVDGPGFQGKLEAFVRPVPRGQPPVRELAPMVKEGEFSEQRAVVIGGSRGLGEVAAKLLAIGGADVTITYHRGKEDAEAVAADINTTGGSCRVAQFDCNHPAPILLLQPPTHLYYFATPHVTSDKKVAFSAERFVEYCRYYVSNFAHTLLEVAQDVPAIDVFYPSTVFLDEDAPNVPEYCAAKAAGEELCKQMTRRFPGWHIYAPRLPRMATDQNNWLVPTEMAAPEIVILSHLREMRVRATRQT
jgi:acyl dehydratase